jgi:translation initiation factor 3 subunit M
VKRSLREHPTIMPSATATFRPQLVHLDGSVEEQLQDFGDRLQIGDDVKASLDKEQREDALAKVVRASGGLCSFPEKDFTGASNLLIHLVISESKDPKKYLPTICGNLHKPITTSPINGPGLALGAFQTIFNLLDPRDELRYHVLKEILKFVKTHGMLDQLRHSLNNLPRWFQQWDTDEENQRKIYLEVVDIALDAGDDE